MNFIKLYHWGYLAAALMCTQIGNCESSIITSDPQNPTVGQNVLLNVKYTGKIHMINWYRGADISTMNSILTFNPESDFQPTTGKSYTGREEGMKNGSLRISNLRITDAGIYTLQLTIPDSFIRDTFQLTVNAENETPHPVTKKPNQTFGPTLNPTDKPKALNNQAVIGGVIGSLAAVILIVIAVVVYFKKYRKPSQAPVYNIEKPSLDKSSEPKKNEVQRLPTVPPRPPFYQNGESNSEEHPYEDLAYVYLSSSYHDLHGQPQT